MKFLKIAVIFIFFYIISANDAMAAGSLSAQILNWDGTPASGGVQFSSSQATVKNPWVRSPQYLRVIYSCDRETWGLRIVTDNEKDIGQVYPKPTDPGADKKYETSYTYVNGQWLTGDDSVSFGGLIDLKTKNNPNYRAPFAWQAFSAPVSNPYLIYKDTSGKWNVGGEWNDDWAYMVDKSDIWDNVKAVGGVYFQNTYPKFEIVVFGSSNLALMTQHPVVSGSKTNPDLKPDGDGDMAIYIATCFGIMDENGDYVGILPKGTYQTTIYVELIYE